MTDQDHLDRINALTSNARQTWFALLAALVFIGITLMGVEHIDFYGVDRATALPLVNIEVPTRYFFAAAPILIAAIYGYFHLYLIRLWDALGAAPARLNGIRLGDAIAPWLVTDAALDFRSEYRRDNSTRPRVLDRSSRYLNFLLAWVFGLILLALLWWQALAARDLLISFVATTSFVVSALTGAESWLARIARLKQLNQSSVPKRVAQRKGIGWIVVIWIGTISSCFGVSYLVTNHVSLITLDLSGESIVERPAGWLSYGDAKAEFRAQWCRREFVKICSDLGDRNADFEEEFGRRRRAIIGDMRRPDWKLTTGIPTNMDFRNADLTNAFLAGVNLRGAKLQGADLSRAQLEGANLRGVKIDGETELRWAQMQSVNLSYARIYAVDIRHARMEGAVFDYAQWIGGKEPINPKKKNISRLNGTDLSSAKNNGGMLRGVDLTQIKFDANPDFRNAFLDGSVKMKEEFPEQMGNPCQWILDEVLDDEKFYGRWRGWIEHPSNPDHGSRTKKEQRDSFWRDLAPKGFEDVPAIEPDGNCEWKTGPMPGAAAD